MRRNSERLNHSTSAKREHGDLIYTYQPGIAGTAQTEVALVSYDGAVFGLGRLDRDHRRGIPSLGVRNMAIASDDMLLRVWRPAVETAKGQKVRVGAVRGLHVMPFVGGRGGGRSMGDYAPLLSPLQN